MPFRIKFIKKKKKKLSAEALIRKIRLCTLSNFHLPKIYFPSGLIELQE